MTNEQLCALALAAIEDADARVVFQDAMQESASSFDERMRIHLGHAIYHGWDTHGVRAIAAVLLFGEWPTSWPLAERCTTRLLLSAPHWASFESVAHAFQMIGRSHRLGRDSEIQTDDSRNGVLTLLLSSDTTAATAEEVARELRDHLPVYVRLETRIRSVTRE